MMTILFAQSTSGLEGVPADFLKSLIICIVVGMGVWAGYRKGKSAGGGQQDPVHLAQPLAITKHPEYAPKKETAMELQKIKDTIEALGRENLRQHEAASKTLTKRLDEISQAGGKRGDEIKDLLHAMELRMTKAFLHEVKDIHERVNPLAENVKGHASAIESLQAFVEKIWAHLFKTKR